MEKKDNDKPWHQLDKEETLKLLDVKADTGLTDQEVTERLEKYGPNEIPTEASRSIFRMIFEQLSDFMIIILIVAAVVSGLLGELPDTIAILTIVVLNAVVGIVQEYKAEESLDALREMSSPHATALRDSKWTDVQSKDLVPGDVLKIETGAHIVADLRIIECASLKVEEAPLTGESVPVDKSPDSVPADTHLAERTSMLYKGTSVTNGHGQGVVTGTGLQTEFGKIAKLLHEEKRERTPLQKKLGDFGKRLTYFLLSFCLLIFIMGIYRGESWVDMFMTAVSLAVAAIPEALPAVMTMSLAFGARDLVKQNALIQRLPAVETLGTVTYICADKTGTLTQNKMHVDQIWCPNESDKDLLLKAMALNNNTETGKDEKLIGDPTETAIFSHALENLDQENFFESYPRIEEIPFESENKRMTTVHQIKGENDHELVFTKGAFEALLPLCTDMPENVEDKATEMASEGLRVLAFAYKKQKPQQKREEWEKELSFLGLVGLIDPPREESESAVNECKTAGIIPIMITGDHPLTARAIAKRVGILEGDEEHEVLTGKDINELDDAELTKKLETVRVFSRAAPEQKIRIVKNLQNQKQYVAMTGDGVNDAPSLKRADIGVAMGITGTDVARKAAHMTLLDDNFATIVNAVREGRRIFDNIKKFIQFVLVGNSGEVLTIFLAPFFGMAIPLLPIHILWVNLITDGMPGLAFSKEPQELGIMERPPRKPEAGFFDKIFVGQIFFYGTLVAGLSLYGYNYGESQSTQYAQTMAFTVLTFCQLILVMGIRRQKEPFFSRSLISNPYMLIAVGLGVGFHLIILYTPAISRFFKTTPLEVGDLVLAAGLALGVGIARDLEKFARRTLSKKNKSLTFWAD